MRLENGRTVSPMLCMCPCISQPWFAIHCILLVVLSVVLSVLLSVVLSVVLSVAV